MGKQRSELDLSIILVKGKRLILLPDSSALKSAIDLPGNTTITNADKVPIPVVLWLPNIFHGLINQQVHWHNANINGHCEKIFS